MTDPASIEIVPLTGAIGAEVRGVDLSRDLGNEAFAIIHQAFLDHLILVFPAQDLAPDAQITFTERLGPVEPHPLSPRRQDHGDTRLLVFHNRPGHPSASDDFWHSDITCAERPPMASFLHARQVPEGRGDTMFCNMYRAFENLSEGMQELLSGLSASHSGEAIRQRNVNRATDGDPDMAVPPPVTHPVVRRHPETGRRALFTNTFFTTHFTDMTVEESRPLLEFIESQAARPENVYRHRWRPGDALLWDNRCTMHYAVKDYDDIHVRHMHRTTAAGDRPAA